MKKLRHTIISIIKISACVIVFGASFSSFSEQPSSDDILQTKLASFTLTNPPTTNWLNISSIENKPDHFIALADNNKIYAITASVIDLVFTAEKALSEQAKVSAIALHPNFSIRDQHGYLTIYLAYSEPFNNTRKFARVIESKENIEFSHDLVIAEWQMRSESNEIDLSTKREVIRIGVPSEQIVINQLGFNPYTKMWNDDFGLLYFGLNHDENLPKSALYSGAILRINPLALGLKGYTAPIDNPFTNQNDINDEIFVTGLQDIKQFIWPNKDDNELLISHTFNNTHQLSLAKGKDDWRETAPQSVVWQSEKSLTNNAMVMYRGKALSHLWGRALVLHQHDNQWQLLSMLMPSQIGSVSTPTIEWQTPSHNKSKNKRNGYRLYTIQNEEVALLDFLTNNLNALSLVSSNGEIINDSENEQTEDPGLTKSNIFPWLLIILIGSFILWAFRYNQKKRLSAKFIVRQQYAHIEISESKQQIGLYRRHQQNAEVVLTITDIKQCIIALNNVNICEIDNEHTFDDPKEVDLRECFSKERREKMVPDKLRQLTITLIDKNNAHYPVCIYLRKGDHRVTRKSYGDVIEDLLDWCWLYSLTINPVTTGIRKPVIAKPTVEEKVKQTTATSANVNPSAFKARPEDTATIKISTVSDIKPTSLDEALNETLSYQSTIDTQLVNALAKLVKLKEQGYLSDDEFSAAKQKLLNDLMSS